MGLSRIDPEKPVDVELIERRQTGDRVITIPSLGDSPFLLEREEKSLPKSTETTISKPIRMISSPKHMRLARTVHSLPRFGFPLAWSQEETKMVR
jgi:hypothetical protein